MNHRVAIVCTGPKYVELGKQLTNAYVEWYDPDRDNGRGEARFTFDIRKAKLFDDLIKAAAYATRVPVNHPLTESGMPNRPLQCFDISYRVVDMEVARQKAKVADRWQQIIRNLSR